MDVFLDEESMKQISNELKTLRKEEIPPEFVSTLDNYNNIIQKSTIDELCDVHGYIPTVLTNVINNPAICNHDDVSDIIAESFLSFLLMDRKNPRSPAPWAAQQLYNLSKQQQVFDDKLMCKKIQCIKAIYKFPSEFLKQLSDDDLLEITNLDTEKEIINEIVNEIDERKLKIPNNLLNSVSFTKLSPNLIYHFFICYVESPTVSIASKMFHAFTIYPSLHILCLNTVFELPKIKTKRAFEMLGKFFMKKGSLPFSLSYFYHQSIKEFIDEVENSNYNPQNSNKEIINDFLEENNESILHFLIPFLFEFPQWVDCIHDININFYSLIIDMFEKM